MSRRRPRRSRRAERERRSRRNLVFACVGAALFSAVALALFLGSRSIHPDLDAETLCPLAQAPTEDHLILLDATDTWGDLQRHVIRQEIKQIQNGLPRFARVHLYTINREPTELSDPALVLCNPGRPEDLEELPLLGGMTGDVVANPAKMVQVWETGFVDRMDSVLSAFAKSTSAPQSRIMETLRGAAVQAFGPQATAQMPKQVHIFSDMLQNSPVYSHYAPQPWTEGRAAGLADRGRLGTGALEGANVSIYLLDRDVVGRSTGQSRSELVRFWDRYLKAQGAILNRVERIES